LLEFKPSDRGLSSSKLDAVFKITAVTTLATSWSRSCGVLALMGKMSSS